MAPFSGVGTYNRSSVGASRQALNFAMVRKDTAHQVLDYSRVESYDSVSSNPSHEFWHSRGFKLCILGHLVLEETVQWIV
jgi:hypothetical protein